MEKETPFSGKISVFDKAPIKTQRFEVSMPDYQGRITVIRKEIIKQLHHMGCTDGLKDGDTQTSIDYEVYRECTLETRQKAIDAVEASLKGV